MIASLASMLALPRRKGMATAEAPGTFDIFNSNQIEPAPSAARDPAINSSTKKRSDEDIRAFAIGANRAWEYQKQTRSRRSGNEKMTLALTRRRCRPSRLGFRIFWPCRQDCSH